MSKINSPKKDISNREFKYFKVNDFAGYKIKPNGGRVALWNCLCKACEKVAVLQQDFPVCEKIKSCGCRQNSRGNKNFGWTGFGKLSGDQYQEIKKNASKRDIPFNLTIEYLWNLYEKQNGKCAVTNEPIEFNVNNRVRKTASLDRIDSDIGYTMGNVRWVHKEVNLMKHVMSDERLIYWCKKILENAKNTSNSLQ